MKISLSPRSAKGFTLIELIIVIAILATLAGIAYPTYMSMQENAGRTAAKKVCTDIVSAVESFKQDNNGLLPYESNEITYLYLDMYYEKEVDIYGEAFSYPLQVYVSDVELEVYDFSKELPDGTAQDITKVTVENSKP